jgi:hypothetical protein
MAHGHYCAAVRSGLLTPLQDARVVRGDISVHMAVNGSTEGLGERQSDPPRAMGGSKRLKKPWLVTNSSDGRESTGDSTRYRGTSISPTILAAATLLLKRALRRTGRTCRAAQVVLVKPLECGAEHGVYPPRVARGHPNTLHRAVAGCTGPMPGTTGPGVLAEWGVGRAGKKR